MNEKICHTKQEWQKIFKYSEKLSKKNFKIEGIETQIINGRKLLCIIFKEEKESGAE